jgi:biopolymer transport protein ExbD
VQSPTAYLLTLLLVASCSGTPDKPDNSEPNIEIRLSSSLNACFIADVEVPCGEVGAKLLAMNVPLSSHIHCVGDTVVSYELVQSILESLDKAGYSTKVGFLTD